MGEHPNERDVANKLERDEAYRGEQIQRLSELIGDIRLAIDEITGIAEILNGEPT